MHSYHASRSIIALLSLATFVGDLPAGEYVAYSLKEAQRRMLVGINTEQEALRNLGGLTEPLAVVRDEPNKDWIIVGQFRHGAPPMSLDDLVVAMRSVMVHRTPPLVSIDRTPETARIGKQTVRYEGGIADTQIGRDMLEADVCLKRLSLGTLRADVWGVRSYLSMLAEHCRTEKPGYRINSRFWIKNQNPSVARREGVFALGDFALSIDTQVLHAEAEGKPIEELSAVRDEVGETFARQVAASFSDLALQFPVLRRARPILAVVALAQGMDELGPADEIQYWLKEYPVHRVPTPKEFELEAESVDICGQEMRLTIEGGIEFNPQVVRLRSGKPSALKEVVLNSRPSPNALVWHPPLAGWPIPNAEENGDNSPTASASRDSGFSVDAFLDRSGSRPHPEALPRAWTLPAPRSGLPALRFHDVVGPGAVSPRVGGVMLNGVAQVSDSGPARVDLSRAGFSLVVNGQNAQLAPETFRKFVTALWAVYFEQQDPGISIDPIAPGVDKHLVRYIGKVINTDLGRVMREADYLMKQWAVGTGRPDFVGFRNPDEIAGRRGVAYVDAMSRLWFAPEAMRFKRGGDWLLFEEGRMTVKTEFVFRNSRDLTADPANEEFARFLTANYTALAQKYPVLSELFEYAKLVSLAKYLKEQGVPLLWFLLANKDLVLTEDSPGTVDALTKGSDHFRGLTIEGGVDLGAQSSYVFDAAAVRAVEQAFAAHGHASTSSKGDSRPTRMETRDGRAVSVQIGQDHYTVVPQHSLTSGKDRHGLRYQTDLGLRSNGQPSLELVRYFDPKQPVGGEFGQGWRLLVPYQVRPANARTVEYRNEVLRTRVPEKMVLKNLLAGSEELLTFSTNRYTAAGYVPDHIETSQVIGLFPTLPDLSFRLVDKLGNEFGFDPEGRLTDLVFSRNLRMHLEYATEVTGSLESIPYRLEPADSETIQFRNATLPKRMKVNDLVHSNSETLAFSADNRLGVVGYVPERGVHSRFQILAVLSDASFRLLDRENQEVVLDAAGRFESVVASSERPLVQSLSAGEQTVTFKYTLDPSGRLVIASASQRQKSKEEAAQFVRYEYDIQGRLCRVTHELASGIVGRRSYATDLQAARSQSAAKLDTH